ncbi:MAG: hypothetical protein MH204_11230 [Fimbriimonadaceae bacterium]|nr:hypothetical protein [Fimbriimonadaceae bacterium]
MVSICLSTILASVQTDPLEVQRPPLVTGVVRLANTPTLDGDMGPEEWDGFSKAGGLETWFQWEPGSLYWAGNVPPGRNLVLSLDQSADGWLVGRDNLEITLNLSRQGEPSVRIRTLDATIPGQPVWKVGGALPESVRLAAKPGTAGTFIEAAFTPAFGQAPEAGRRIGIRLDAIAEGEEVSEPFRPRGLAYCFLQTDAGLDLPIGISWRPEITNRNIARLDRIGLRFRVSREEGAWTPTRVEMRGEGAARESLAQVVQPTPGFDSRGNLTMAYDSVIAPGSEVGWRVIRATFQNAAGETFTLRSSIRLSELVDIELGFPRETRASADAQIIRGTVTLRSQFSGRLQGVFSLTAPSEWTVTRGREQNFLIYHTRGTARIPVEFVIPRGAAGTFPLVFRAKIGEETVERVIFYSVD